MEQKKLIKQIRTLQREKRHLKEELEDMAFVTLKILEANEKLVNDNTTLTKAYQDLSELLSSTTEMVKGCVELIETKLK